MNFPTLPEGYRQIEVIDLSKNRRQMLIVNIGSLVIAALVALAGLWMRPFAPSREFLDANWWAWLAVGGMMFAYILLHELVHGVVMYALSGVKPSYGLKLPYAYAGSSAHFDKRSYLLIALAPVALWGAVLFVLERALPVEWFWLLYIVQILNLSGAAGDLYCAFHLSRLPKDILIQDSGTRMRVFAPRPTDEEQT